MKTYVIDYNNGVTKVEKVENLEEAKKIAEDGMSLTQRNVTIFDADEMVAESIWWAVNFGDDDDVLCNFGDYGFYGVWQ